MHLKYWLNYYYLLAGLILISVSSTLQAQEFGLDEEIEMRQEMLEALPEDTSKVKTYLELAELTSSINIDDALPYAEKALALAKKIKNQKFTVKTLILMGDAYRLSLKNKKALEYYLQAEKAMQGMPPKEKDAYSFYFIANEYQESGKAQKAEEYYLKCLEIIEVKNDLSVTNIRFISLLGLTTLHKNEGEYDDALKYYQKLDSLHKAMQEEELIVLNKSESNLLIKSIYRDIVNARAEKQRAFNNLLIGLSIVILFSVAIVLYVLNVRRKKTNALLSAKNEEIESERKKSDSLLLNILPAEVAEELKTKGESSVKHYERVSVLFTDFKGFTSISENMPPEQLIEELNDCFVNFDEIIHRYDIEKIKTIGDAYMCAGGIPIASRDNPLKVVLASLEMQNFMQKRRREKKAKGQDYWQCRLGVNTGSVIAGVIGKSKFAYDIWGDTVNTASRMESSGEVAKVNISGNTYALVKDFFEFEARGKITAKGKGEVEMYFVNRIKPELSADEAGFEPNTDFWELAKQKF